VPLRLDAIDRQIVARLIANGRASASDISRSLEGVSQRAVRYRLERLQRHGVMRVGAVVDPHAIGFDVIADVFIEVAPGEVQQVARRLVDLERVSYVAASIGQGDLSIQICARDGAELERLVADVVRAIPGVRSARTVMVSWKLKDVHQWQIPAAAVDV
jgi:Lrp/AsnC family transcriptional regulator for asnA, asnC and gidA